MRFVRTAFILLLIACGALPAPAQEAAAPVKQDDISINLVVNYGSAYRRDTWVPVDVLVRNGKQDVEGSLEIRLYNQSEEVVSPIYSVPIDSPKDSYKRFRVYCRMQNVSRMEAQLYHGHRAVMQFPSWMAINPIDDKDFLCLVLDDRPEDYGFLSTALYQGEENVRFFRESLTTETAGLLADYQVCFDPFDLVVLGNIDPAAIDESHRQLLANYVQRGGVLAVFLGASAGRYRGSWVEPLIGATIGADAIHDDQELGLKVFSASGPPERHTAQRQGTLATLTPTGPEVKKLGADPIAAVMRSQGNGAVLAFAFDSESMLLQTHPQYHALWRDILARGNRIRPLNYDGVVQFALPQVLRAAGVQLFPLSSVIKYLLLYFFLAIVVNWLVWNHLKRREMAWVCLVILSFGFTGYAMFFGTSGRAGRTEIEQFEILRLLKGQQSAEAITFTGILSEGSDYYNGKLLDPNALLEEVAVVNPRQQIGAPGMGLFGASPGSPYTFIQDDPPQFRDLRVGASDVRFVRTLGGQDLAGGIEGECVWRGTYPEAKLVNNTGLQILAANLIVRGQPYPLMVSGSELSTLQGGGGQHQAPPNLYWQTSGGGRNAERETLQWQFMSQLLMTPDQQWDAQFPPHVLAIVAGDPAEVLSLGEPATVNLKQRVLIAEIGMRREGAQSSEVAVDEPVPVQLIGGQGFDPYGSPQQRPRSVIRRDQLRTRNDLLENGIVVHPAGFQSLQLTAATWYDEQPQIDIQLDVYTSTDSELVYGLLARQQSPAGRIFDDVKPDLKLVREISAGADQNEVLVPVQTEEVTIDNVSVRRQRYILSNLTRGTSTIRLMMQSENYTAIVPIATAVRKADAQNNPGAAALWQ